VGNYANREYDTNQFRYAYESFITPHSVFDYDMENGTSVLLKEREVPGGYDRTRYQVEQIYATAADGVKIPISVVHLKGAKLDGHGPLFLYGYGSYGASMDIDFDPEVFSWSTAEWLMPSPTSAARRDGQGVARPGSNDAEEKHIHRLHLLCGISGGARLRLRRPAGDRGSERRRIAHGRRPKHAPDLFHAAIVGVPFVDVINTMLDESIPLTVPEFEEWGNPKEKAAFDYMISYSPYDNIEAKNYPNMLVKTSWNDSQVMYWEPTKYVAKMRALRTDHNTFILKANLSPAGHGGVSGRYDRLHQRLSIMPSSSRNWESRTERGSRVGRLLRDKPSCWGKFLYCPAFQRVQTR